MRTGILVGNPKPYSRTFRAAEHVAERLGGSPPAISVDVVRFGSMLLDWPSADPVRETIAALGECDLLVVASPTYKAAPTGLLKLFLDQVGVEGLAGVVAVPLMLGGDLRHSLAPDVFLRPVLIELGATCPTAGLFLLEDDEPDAERLKSWETTAAPIVRAACRGAG